MDIEDEESNSNDTTDEMVPSLTEENVYCEYFPENMVRNSGGIILQFSNIIIPFGSLSIGVTRIKMNDIRKLPNYLSKYRQLVKQHAFSHLARGTTKKLYIDDYAMSFSVASLSAAGRSFIPKGRNDGPLYFCVMSGLVEAVKLYRDEDNPDTAHVINVFIYRNDVEQTQEEEEAAIRKKQLQVNNRY